MSKVINKTKTTKVVKNNNGSTTTFTKGKKQNGTSKWFKSGGSGKPK